MNEKIKEIKTRQVNKMKYYKDIFHKVYEFAVIIALQ